MDVGLLGSSPSNEVDGRNTPIDDLDRPDEAIESPRGQPPVRVIVALRAIMVIVSRFPYSSVFETTCELPQS